MYPSVRTLFLAAMLPFILCVPDRVTATNEPSSCVTACSIWSQVLGFCEGPFGTNSSQQGVAAANAFISCLCMGNMQDQAVGNQSFSAAISTCGGCFTTPQVIQDQLSQLQDLCATQAINGTAFNATSFNPTPYTTSNDPGALGLHSSSSPRATPAGIAQMGAILLLIFYWPFAFGA